MGVADFAFANSVSFRRKSLGGEATEIILEPHQNTLIAKNHSGQELYTLTQDGAGEFSMRDSHGHAVLQSKRGQDHSSTSHIFDRQGQIIGTSDSSSFQWENVSIAWTAKSLGLISDALLVAREVCEEKSCPGSPKESPHSPKYNLAEIKMSSGKQPGYLRVGGNIITSPAYPPLGLFLFQAMILNQEYVHSSTLRRLSMTSSFRR